jgi:hypothetical protein
MTHDALRLYKPRSQNAVVVEYVCAGATMSIAASARVERTASRLASQRALRVASLAPSRAVLCEAHQVLNWAYHPCASVARPTPMCVPHAVVCPCAGIVIPFVCVLPWSSRCGLLNQPLGR